MGRDRDEYEIIDAEVVEGEIVEKGGLPALFGQPVQVERHPLPLPGMLDLRREWQRCFDSWLDETAISPKTRRAYTRAWEDLLNFCADPPSERLHPIHDFWDITHRYIRAWMTDLTVRPLDERRVQTLRRRGRERTRGYSQSTIGQYLAAVSSFYSYAESNWPVMLPNGREVALTRVSGMDLNPVQVIKRRKAEGAAPKREQAYLSAEQLRRFLHTIPKSTTQGLRDYALFLFYALTGGRNSEVRTLRWEDFQERGGRMFWHWKGKGRGRKDSKEAWKELPPECWEAIRRYLKAAGRWDAMEPESAVFTALSERAANLPTISNELWDPHAKPLSAREVNRLVKKYARRAGLDPNDVHVHTLRHSAAMLMDEAGADVEEIRKFLNHESLNTTQTYMHKMKGQRNVHAGKMAELLGL